jgi:hypothetical protein
MENLFVIAGEKRSRGIVRYKDIYHRARVLFGKLVLLLIRVAKFRNFPRQNVT